MEFRIVMSEHDEALEKKIKLKLAPYCSSIFIVEEDGDAGLTISIIALVLALPEFVVSIKEIMSWLNQRKAVPFSEPNDTQNNEKQGKLFGSESAFSWSFEIAGQKFNLEDIESKEKQDYILDLIIEEFRNNE